MKNIRFFPTRQAYSQYLYSSIFRCPEFHAHPFYRGLTEFIIDQRTPLFFEASEEYERAHFTQYFNFTLVRDSYANDYVRDLYFVHDCVHMIFYNPLQVHSYNTLKHFSEIADYNEYVAANDTEVLTYYRLPELRAKTFPYKILYDFVREEWPEKPTVRQLFELRHGIIEKGDDGFLAGKEGSTGALAFLRKFRENNAVWCQTWYENFPTLSVDYTHHRLSLPIMDYEDFLLYYRSEADEDRYRSNVLLNTRVALEILGEKHLPTRFEECESALKCLEGRVILDKVARTFHAQYVKSMSKSPEQ